METQQDLKRLLKKLSALQVTLKGDERSMLDGMVIGLFDEVVAHKMKTRAFTKAVTDSDEAEAYRMATKAFTKAVTDSDEAEAHKMMTKAVTRAFTESDEVEAHTMVPKIIIDPVKDEYRVVR
jgi:hypothetical protein